MYKRGDTEERRLKGNRVTNKLQGTKGSVKPGVTQSCHLPSVCIPSLVFQISGFSTLATVVKWS